uniref:Uncharacterized protein n=1 Tax=Anguilla anguilla TaxID=7936 RepID=A0A0E9TRG7_ANGAN
MTKVLLNQALMYDSVLLFSLINPFIHCLRPLIHISFAIF